LRTGSDDPWPPKPSEAPPSTGSAQWRFQFQNDPMRKAATTSAILSSETTARFEFPYEGEQHLRIVIRRSNNADEVLLVIEKGQIVCHTDGCQVSMKFDDRPVETWYASASNRSDGVFLSRAGVFVARLKKTKTLYVELEFYRAGNRQFKFAIPPLEWPRKS
jgi:hypothetical protein